MKKRSYSPANDPIIKEFALEVRKQLGARVKNLYLYGSRARGDAWEGSDYDYALLVDKRDRDLEETLLDIVVDILDRHDALISAQIFTEEEWALESKLALGINIIKEGIAF